MYYLMVIISLTIVAALQPLDQLNAQSPPGRTTASSFSSDITAAPKQLQWHQDVTESVSPGSETDTETLGSVCGFVTSDIHQPLNCDKQQYCFTDVEYLQCCSTTTQILYTFTYANTMASTERNTLTTTIVSTSLSPSWVRYGSNCTTAYQACYDYNYTSSCTNGCTSTALLCTDPDVPYCASLFSCSYTIQHAVSYFCDTAAYGLEFFDYGQWPSITSMYTITPSSNTTPTFTPTVVPFIMTQASSPATSATVPGPTSASVAISYQKTTPTTRMLATLCLLGLCYLLS